VSLSAGPALAIMARAPLPGHVKTRLQPGLNPAESATLAMAFFQDAVDLVSSFDAYHPFLAYTPSSQRALFKQIVPESFGLLPQAEADLGQRMHYVFVALSNKGHSPVVLIGSDIPTLQPSIISHAFDCLSKNDVCLGPSRDGGYYLIGLRAPRVALFQDIPWSTRRVFEVTISKIQEASLSYALLDTCCDVDTVDDLLCLRDEILALEKTQGARIPQRTRAWLNSFPCRSIHRCSQTTKGVK
jgi:rSAM/selenodomain-associated transferase 1